MKKQFPVGLVVEGNSTGSAVLRLPKIAEELGPVKSAAMRVARRLSNLMRAGYAVEDYEELQAARLILLRMPDSSVPRVVDELCTSELAFKDLSFVLCESWLRIEILEPLRARGASIATVVAVPSKNRDWFAIEGQTAAVRQLRRFLERNEARAVELRPGSKALFFAAELLITALPVPLLMAAQQAMRVSGISGNRLAALQDQVAQEMFRSFIRGARTTWGGPLNECSSETATAHLAALRENHNSIAQVVDAHLDWARKRMSKQKR